MQFGQQVLCYKERVSRMVLNDMGDATMSRKKRECFSACPFIEIIKVLCLDLALSLHNKQQ